MTKPLPSEVLAAIASDRGNKPADKLDAIREKASEARDVEAEIADLEMALEDKKEKLKTLLQSTLPEMMDQAAVPAIELAPRGNLPAVRVSVKPFIGAGISAKWPEEKKRAAYDWLDANGAGDLIKTQLSVAYPREKRSEALRAAASLGGLADVRESVSSQTLSAWLREKVDAGEALPPLDLIGGFVRRAAKIEEI